jgi:gamma-glutamylcyclotransferase (GGCT)/AIG2-like uncharacterized protein YtfP
MTALQDAMVFVYGTLCKGFPNHHVLRGLHARLLGRGYVKGRLFELAHYPGAVKGGRHAEKITGEVYALPDSQRALQLLDQFEGVSSSNPAWGLFRRELTTVTLKDGEQLQAWVYWLCRTAGKRRRIPSGNYRRS